MSLAKEILRNGAIALLYLSSCTFGSPQSTPTNTDNKPSSGERTSPTEVAKPKSTQLTLEELGITRFSRQVFLIDLIWNKDRAFGTYGLDSPRTQGALKYITDRCDVRSVNDVGGNTEIGKSFPRIIITVVVADGDACIPEG